MALPQDAPNYSVDEHSKSALCRQHTKTQQACLLFFSKSGESNYQHFTYSSDSYLMMKYFWFSSTTFP